MAIFSKKIISSKAFTLLRETGIWIQSEQEKPTKRLKQVKFYILYTEKPMHAKHQSAIIKAFPLVPWVQKVGLLLRNCQRHSRMNSVWKVLLSSLFMTPSQRMQGMFFFWIKPTSSDSEKASIFWGSYYPFHFFTHENSHVIYYGFLLSHHTCDGARKWGNRW
jgi:hypothetical protein